jgi:hypothetical protein
MSTRVPSTEGSILDLTKPAKKAKREALKKISKAANEPILLFETPEMMNKIM